MTLQPSGEPATPLRGHDAGEGWHLGLARNTWLAVVGIGVGVLLAGSAVVAARSGRPAAAVLLAVIAVGPLLAPWWRSRRRLPAYDYEGPEGSGLALPLNPMSWPAVLGCTIFGCTALAGLTLIVTGRARADSPVAAVLGGVLCAALAALFLLGAVGGVLQRRPTRGRFVLLTPEAVVLTSERRPVRVPWTAIRAVRPHWTSRRQGWFRSDDLVSNWLSLAADPEQVAGRTHLSALALTADPTIAVAELAVDPWHALAVLRHYLEHPGDRAELRSTLAVDRFQALV
ncbi:hypothetical protein [Nocardioides ultimimeridianus]